jgi:long-chain acyl-CoA synthetase
MSPQGAGERIVITGATGFLGEQILRTLLSRRPEASLVLLIRDTAEQSASQRLDTLLKRCLGEEESLLARRRIEVLPGDVTAERAGLSRRDWSAAAEGATRIIHGAASVRFDMSLGEARRINVEGARHMLRLAEEAHRGGSLRSFTYVSTSFVAGRREGLVREDELETGQRFRNSYERSKCEAEALVGGRAAELPVTILRPSIIVGDSRTGATSSFHTIYWPLRVYARKGWRILPGRGDTQVDMVPVQFVAQATERLAFESLAAGRTFHLCAGPDRGATIGEIAESAARFFRLPPPRFVPPALFLTLLRPLLAVTLWGPRRRILRQGRLYRPYLDMRLEFDTTQADALLEPAGIVPPRVMDYLERLFAFCVETDWGRRLPGQAAAP